MSCRRHPSRPSHLKPGPAASPRTRGLAVVFAVVLASLAIAQPASAKTSPRVMPQSTLQADGSVIGRVAVTCDPGLQTLEARLSLSQDDQSLWGMTGIGILQCDGRPHFYSVRVRPFDGSFHRGAARASAYVVRYDPDTGESEEANATRVLRVR